MGIERRIVILSVLVIFGLTPLVYSKDFSHVIKEFRTNFLDQKARNMGYDVSKGEDKLDNGEEHYGGGWKPKGGVEGVVGRAAFSFGHKAADLADSAAHVDVVKTADNLVGRANSMVNDAYQSVYTTDRVNTKNLRLGSNSYAKNRNVSAKRNGAAAGRLWESVSSFNPALRGPITRGLDINFNRIRKQGKGDTAVKQFGSGLWNRIFPKRTPSKIPPPQLYTTTTMMPPGSPQVDFKNLNLSLLPNDAKKFEVSPKSEIKNSEATSGAMVNDTKAQQIDIASLNNEKILKDLKEKRGVPFVKNQTLGDSVVYTEIASKDDPKNGQVLYVVNKKSGFSVEYIDSEPFVIIFDDGRENSFLNIDEDADAGYLKVRDSNGIIYEHREKYVEGSKVITVENPLPVEFSKYIDKNGGHFKKEGVDEYFHVDKKGENKKLVFTEVESSRGLFFLTYDADSSEGILKPKSAISGNGKGKITFSELDEWTMVDSDGVKWRTYPYHYFSGEKDKRVDYISLTERPGKVK